MVQHIVYCSLRVGFFIKNEQDLKKAGDKLINQLDNVGIEADLDTEIPNDVIKKLSKLYKKDIKPIKAKKSIEPSGQTTKPTNDENQSEGKIEAEKAKKIEASEKVEPKKPQEDKKPKQNKVEEKKQEIVNKFFRGKRATVADILVYGKCRCVPHSKGLVCLNKSDDFKQTRLGKITKRKKLSE